MKKLLFAIAGAAAFSAFAADPSPRQGSDIDVLGFENFDFTNPNVTGAVINRDDTGVENTSKWSCSGDDASLVKTYGGDNAAAPSGISFPAPFEDAGDNYLALDTNGSELQRLIPAADQAIAADGTYVDTLVQFTPSESAPGEGDLTGAKLAIWLGVDSEHNTTNLMVAGAYYMMTDPEDETTLTFTTSTNYTLSGTYEPGTWYRLTVKAISTLANGAEGQYLPGFVVSIDGQALNIVGSATDSPAYTILTEGGLVTGANKDLLDANQFIPALGVSDTTIAPTLTSVGFKGTGAIDDFVVTTAEPDFTPAGGNDYKVVIDDSDVVITPQAGDLAALQAAIVAGGGTLDVTDVAAVNAALAAPIPGTSPAIPSWQALFLGVAPTTNGLEQVAIESITIENGTVTVAMSDDLTLMTGRGVDIVLKVLGSDDLSTWGSTPLATATNTLTIPAITPAQGETKKFYKVVVEFAATPPAQN